MNSFLHWLWPATLAGSAAIVLTLPLMPLLRRFLGAQAAFPAWIFALGLLVSPWELRSPASVLPPASDLPPVVVQVVVPYHSFPPASAPQPLVSRPRPFPWLFTIWAGGASVLLALSATRLIRTRQLVSRSRNITSELQAVLTAIGGLPRRAQVRESQEIGSPAMCGIFRPVILLPAGWSEERDLHWILLHEVGHIRRGDLLWRWAFEIVRIIHWYNPLVWLAERAARIDQEMACDEWVLARADESAHPDYGEAILRAAQRPSGNWLMQAAMAESRSGLNRRINHLAAAHPRRVGTVIVTLLLGAAALIFLSPASHSETNSVPNLPAGSATPTPAPSTVPPAASPAPVATSQSGPPTQVEFESILVEVDPETADQIFGTDSEGQQTILQTKEAQDLIQKLSQQKGTDLVSAPKVSTRSGRKAIVQVSREFPYPTEYAPPETNEGKPGPAYRIPATPTTFEVRNVGISLEVTPEITRDNRIICELTPSAVDFLGFVNYGAKGPEKAGASEDALDVALRPVANTADVINQPIFRKREINTTVILRSGQSIVLGGLARQDKQATGAVSGFPAGFPPQQGGKEVNRTLFILVRARLLNAKGIYLSAEEASIAPPAAPPVPSSDVAAVPSAKPEPTPQAPTASAAPRTSHPYGRPVEGRPGFVTSPWAPDKGFVDVNGFPTGTEVMCPYTQKVFLVP